MRRGELEWESKRQYTITLTEVLQSRQPIPERLFLEIETGNARSKRSLQTRKRHSLLLHLLLCCVDIVFYNTILFNFFSSLLASVIVWPRVQWPAEAVLRQVSTKIVDSPVPMLCLCSKDYLQAGVVSMNVNDYETQTTETGEREAIWQIIQSSAEECGLSDPPEDVTEEWREW